MCVSYICIYTYIQETLTLHITHFKAAVGYDFFIKLNADFMLEIAREPLA